MHSRPTPHSAAPLNGARLTLDFKRPGALKHPLTATMALALAIVGCRDPKVAVYQVAKEPEAQLPVSTPTQAAADTPAPAAMPSMPPAAMPSGAPGADPHALQTASTNALTWTAPSGWQPKQASAIRKATFVVGLETGAPAELAISAFPGDVGGDVANVNRWRGQVGLPELSDSDAAGSIQRLEANGLKIGIVDVGDASSPNAPHLLGAMVPYDGATWFFKLTGPNATVAGAKPAFVEFIKTVKPAAPATP